MALFSVEDILKCVQSVSGRVVNEGSLGSRLSSIRVERMTEIRDAKPSDLIFFFSKAYQHELLRTHPGILVTGEAFVGPLKSAQFPWWESTAVIACQDPYLAMALVSETFAPHFSTGAHVPEKSAQALSAQVHPSAQVSPQAELGLGVKVGAHCVIEDGARLGDRVTLYPGCYVGHATQIGDDTVLFPNVVLYETITVGNRVRIHAGSVIGSDGFGYAPRREGKDVVDHQKIYHLGRVVIEDDVEIGANSCVDRGTLGETRIGKKSKLDNLVHIGHNARLEEGVIVCGGSCLAGNASVGQFAYVGGLSGITNHVHIGARGSVGALTLATKDVKPGGTAVGNPQREYLEHFKAHAKLSRLVAERRKK